MAMPMRPGMQYPPRRPRKYFHQSAGCRSSLLDANCKSDPAPAYNHRNPQQNGQSSRQPCWKRQQCLVLPSRQILGAYSMKDRHVQAGRANETNLGDEIAVPQVLGGVGNEEQQARGNGNGKRAPGEGQNSTRDAAQGPVN